MRWTSIERDEDLLETTVSQKDENINVCNLNLNDFAGINVNNRYCFDI